MENKTAIYFKVTESEKVQIEINAKMRGKTVSAYIRDQALEKKRKIDEVVIDSDNAYVVMNEADDWIAGHNRKHIEVASLYLKYYGVDNRENKNEHTYKQMVDNLDSLFKYASRIFNS
jgi:hypothetical protein